MIFNSLHFKSLTTKYFSVISSVFLESIIMEELGSALSFYQEQNIELNYKLQGIQAELESTKMEMVKKEEYLKDLLELLKSTMKERDETIYELHYLESMMLKCINDQPPQPQNNSPISTMPDAKTNSDSSIISESPNHFSADETYLNYSHQGSYSPQLSNNMAEYSSQIDLGSDVIENLSQGKPLPLQGKLLQAVSDAGTVLPQNLLPTRRNRPPPSQPFQILPEGAGAGEGSSWYNN